MCFEARQITNSPSCIRNVKVICNRKVEYAHGRSAADELIFENCRNHLQRTNIITWYTNNEGRLLYVLWYTSVAFSTTTKMKSLEAIFETMWSLIFISYHSILSIIVHFERKMINKIQWHTKYQFYLKRCNQIPKRESNRYICYIFLEELYIIFNVNTPGREVIKFWTQSLHERHLYLSNVCNTLLCRGCSYTKLYL